VKDSSKAANDNAEISSAVYDSIALGLDFSHGAVFSSNVRKSLDPLFIHLVLLIIFTRWFLLEEQNSNYQKIRWALL
jgi:hypothetical protein